MYRPKFCAECGAKVVRLRWRPWTSRRFCDGCAPRFLRTQLIQLASASGVLLLLGMAIGNAARPAPPPLLLQKSQLVSSPTTAVTVGVAKNPISAPPVENVVYMCGARTKKGTPCTRRVHGPVRCWQHKGMPAMLAQEKLLIKD